MFTVDRLREVVAYDRETGIFTWLVNKGKAKAGSAAGCKNRKRGHVYITIDNYYRTAGRVAWMYVTGQWPTAEVDHKDRNKENNRWANLRLATRKQNSENVGLSSRNTSGFRGVTWNKERGLWQAQIGHSNRVLALGRYETIIDAAAARLRSERSLFTHSERCAS